MRKSSQPAAVGSPHSRPLAELPFSNLVPDDESFENLVSLVLKSNPGAYKIATLLTWASVSGCSKEV